MRSVLSHPQAGSTGVQAAQLLRRALLGGLPPPDRQQEASKAFYPKISAKLCSRSGCSTSPTWPYDPRMSKFEYSRSKFIPAPAAQVFAKVVDFHLWTQWSPWENMDPQMTRKYSGEPSGPGAKYEWAGKKAGSGSMEILRTRPDQEIQIDLRFTKPIAAKNPTTFTFEEANGGTQVTWTMRGENRGFSAIFAKLFNMEKMIGKDFEKGLDAMAEAVAND